jgi:hypothetical protein
LSIGFGFGTDIVEMPLHPNKQASHLVWLAQLRERIVERAVAQPKQG